MRVGGEYCFFGIFLSLRHNFTCPCVDTAEFVDVGVAHIAELLRRLVAAVAASAIDENDLVQIGQFLRLLCADALVGNQDSTRNIWKKYSYLRFPSSARMAAAVPVDSISSANLWALPFVPV